MSATALVLRVPSLAIFLLAAPRTTSAAERRISDVSRLPATFEVNRGQTDRRVMFVSRGSGYTLFLTATEAVLALRRPTARTTPIRQLDVVRIELIGANPSPRVIGLGKLSGKSNYFVGNDATRWRTDVSTYERVEYENVYPGINLIYYGKQRQIEHDFVLLPGADPRLIRVSVRGATRPRIDAAGDVLVGAPGGMISLRRPRAYQDREGGRQPVSAHYVFKAGGQLGFDIGDYDATKPLVIDPVLNYSTYLGGTGDDSGNAIAVDSAGNAYVTGQTASTNFPRADPIQPALGGAGADDAFVTKLSATGGALIYSTYLGGSGEDAGLGIAVDSAGNAYVTGQTASSNFPTTATARQPTFAGGNDDGFVAVLNPAGNVLMYSTYLGGTGDDIANGMALDSAGGAYVIGQTDSPDFPTTPGAFQTGPPGKLCGPPNCFSAFVAKLSNAGSVSVYSTYLGGNRLDVGTGIAVDPVGNAYVTGFTESDSIATTPGAFQPNPAGGVDAFVAKVNAAGTGVVYSTFLGGTLGDRGFAIAVDSAGGAYVAGMSDSFDFPTRNPFQAARGGPRLDAFVTKFDSTGAVAYSTYLGGDNDDRGFGIAVDSAGNAYVGGFTFSTDFPTERPMQTASDPTKGDVFVTELSPSGDALVYSTYLGGSGRDRGFGIALGPRNAVYITGFTDSSNFPTVGGAFQSAIVGATDAFVAAIDDTAPDFTLRVSGASDATITCGQTANYELQVVPVNAFNGSVAMTCDIASQGMAELQGIACNLSAGSVSVTSGAVPLGVSVVTTARSTVLPPARFSRPDNDGSRPVPLWLGPLVLLAILAGLVASAARRLGPELTGVAVIVLLLLDAELSGCSLGGGQTRSGFYGITVTGTHQVTTRTAKLELTVDCPR